jgi:putative transposase
LDGFISDFAGLIGVERACRAFGTPARSYRYRRRCRRPATGADADAGQGTADTGDAGASPVTTEATAETVAVPSGAAPVTDEDSRVPAAAAAITLPPAHPAALTTDERYEVLNLLCSDRFMDLSPHQVFMTLLDEGTYYCSVRSMYRLLEDHGFSGDRRRGGHQNPKHHAAPIVQATRPNEAWSWDITKLRGPTKGVVFYLYTILDIFSRKVVGWTLSERESASIAQHLIRSTLEREGVTQDQLTLHADRGGPMIAGDLAELLAGLGVRKSHSRPRVSNDNPYSEAQFKTLKYRPDYPQRFESLTAARAWCRAFFSWYNTTHYHSGIAYLRPTDVHEGRHPEILQRRQKTLDQAYAKTPRRFRRPPHAKKPPQRAWINQPAIQTS